MKLSITIPENLNDVSLGQYQKWLKIAKDKEQDHFLQKKMIEIFCNVPLKQVLQIKANDIKNICLEISKLFTKEPRFIDRFNLNGKEFGFVPSLDEMTFGEYVDLDTYLNDWDLMHKAMGVLFRPITYKKKKQYLIEDYERADKYDMKDMTLDIVFGATVFFYNFKERITESYSELFGDTEGDRIATASSGFSAKWGWYQSIYGLANGDILKYDEITKQNIHKCLTFLSFEKDKYKLETQMLKSKR